jgi:hypothetical protein
LCAWQRKRRLQTAELQGKENEHRGIPRRIKASFITRRSPSNFSVKTNIAKGTRRLQSSIRAIRKVLTVVVQDFTNNIFINIPNTGSNDQTAVDFETRNEATNFKNNYMAGNAGPGIEFLTIHGSTVSFLLISNLYF